MWAADEPVFNMPHKNHVAEMLRADPAAARTAWIDNAGTREKHEKREAFGFLAYHDESVRAATLRALRHMFITDLGRGGVHPKAAQALARDSTITLSMNRYSRSIVGEQAAALAVLPEPTPHPAAEEQVTSTGATG